MIEVRQYVDLFGRNPFELWINKLDRTTRARVAVAISRVQSGNLASARSVGAGVLELRLDFGPGYRIYFGRVGSTLVIVLGGESKSGQDADIIAAHAHWREYKKRQQET